MPRLYLPHPFTPQAELTLDEAQAHYLTQVLRLKPGDTVQLFNGADGEWRARIASVAKRAATLTLDAQTRSFAPVPDLMVCFAPPRGGRTETIIEKATELGARILQPVKTEFSVVDRINPQRLEATAREAAEQSERLDLPELRPMVSLSQLLGSWDATRPLLYGDESGASEGARIQRLGVSVSSSSLTPESWPLAPSLSILIGPEGGFSPAEHALLQRLPFAHGVSLGPRILRADTAVITLTAIIMSIWGDWHERPRFQPGSIA
jgi:16S rRNA (uracil1498-N3)-methyltransferase